MPEKRSYLKLQSEVWDTGICCGCGACTAVCPADALYFIDEPGINHPSSSGYCKNETDSVPCGACYDACPRTSEPRKEPLGPYLRIMSAQSNLEIPNKQSGGAVTAILISAMRSGLIDGVITITEDRWTHAPSSILITDEGELTKHAGSRYNWSVPVLRSLKEAIVGRKLSRIAIVGTPCVVQAARFMKNSKNDLLIPFGRSIRLILGLFCTESFDYHTLMEEILRDKHQISAPQISRMDVRGKLELTLTDNTIKNLSLDEIDSAVRKGCHSCTDFSALDADIAAGSVGTPAGFTTLIIRTPDGEAFVNNAVHNNSLTASEQVDIDAIEKLAKSKLSRVY